jgi:hypothetical protein
MKGNPVQRLLSPFEQWRKRRRIDRLKARGNPDWEASQASEGPIARALQRTADAVDPRIVIAVIACIAVAAVGAAGYLIGESKAVGASDAAAARRVSFQHAFDAARRDATAQGKERGSAAGARAGKRAAEKAGARAGARRGAAAAAREQAALAAAAQAAERRARRQAHEAETPAPTTTPAPEPVAPEPAPPEPCFDVAGFPC